MLLHLAILFIAKVFDNMLATAKTILVQRNRCVLAGLSLAVSNFLYLCITKNIVTSNSGLALIVVSVASGVGCCLAVAVSNKFSKDKTYVNVIMSDAKLPRLPCGASYHQCGGRQLYSGLEPENHYHYCLC